MSKTSIAWTEHTWNPVRGCSRVSPGCVNCYAERMAARGLPGMNSPTTGEPFAIMTPSGPHWTGKVELIPSRLDIPLRRRKPTTYFVNSTSDLFHEDMPMRDLMDVFNVMRKCPDHTFQVLTKRGDVMASLMDEIALEFGVLPNVWLGVSVEDQQRADERIAELIQTPAAVRFLSVEPLLGPVDLTEYFGWNAEIAARGMKQPLASALLTLSDVPGIDWVIVGGESGPGARPCDLAWIRSIVEQCRAAGVACFVKQLGAYVVDTRLGPECLAVCGWPFGSRRDGTRVLLKDPKGGEMAEWPEDLRVREMPK